MDHTLHVSPSVIRSFHIYSHFVKWRECPSLDSDSQQQNFRVIQSECSLPFVCRGVHHKEKGQTSPKEVSVNVTALCYGQRQRTHFPEAVLHDTASL